MKPLSLEHGATALLVVAHPDDETIWMGGTILKNPHVKWTIFSLCRGDDEDRAPKYRAVCKRYGAKGIISDLEDEGLMSIRQSIHEIERRIVKELKQKHFTYIFTHGYNGEYGHERHIGVHRAMKKLIKEKKLVGNQAYFFALWADTKKRMHNDTNIAKVETTLTRGELREKRDIIKKLYRFSQTSFENTACLARETFTT